MPPRLSGFQWGLLREKEENASRPVSRVLSTPFRALDDHSSGTHVAMRFARPTRAAGWKGPWALRPAPPLFGLAPGGVYRAAPVAGRAVRSCRTVSPLLRTNLKRSVLCGTIPGVAPAGRYPAPHLHGARTFLPEGFMPSRRPSGQLADAELGARRPAVNRPWNNR